MSRSASRRAAGASVLALAAPLAATTAYRMLLLAAAARGLATRHPASDAASDGLRLTVVVPAHDEEAVLGRTLASLSRSDYPQQLVEVAVVADNCSDGTAEVARRAGASVLERDEPEQRGKGQALAWALRALEPRLGDAVVFVDADCEAAPNLLRALARRLSGGARAVQADYRVANPEASSRAALRYAGFALQNSVRSAGRAALGVSAGLLGTGMAFHRDLLAKHPWEAFSFVEDREQHLRLVEAGERVEFAPETWVRTPVPVGAGAAATQELRWETGRLTLLRRYGVDLLREGLRRRDLARVDAALELLLPPQSLAALGGVLALALGRIAGRRAAVRMAWFDLLGQAVFVVGGLALARAPACVYRALLASPVFIAERLRLVASSALHGRPASWERTGRAAPS